MDASTVGRGAARGEAAQVRRAFSKRVRGQGRTSGSNQEPGDPFASEWRPRGHPSRGEAQRVRFPGITIPAAPGSDPRTRGTCCPAHSRRDADPRHRGIEHVGVVGRGIAPAGEGLGERQVAGGDVLGGGARRIARLLQRTIGERSPSSEAWTESRAASTWTCFSAIAVRAGSTVTGPRPWLARYCEIIVAAAWRPRWRRRVEIIIEGRPRRSRGLGTGAEEKRGGDGEEGERAGGSGHDGPLVREPWRRVKRAEVNTHRAAPPRRAMPLPAPVARSSMTDQISRNTVSRSPWRWMSKV